MERFDIDDSEKNIHLPTKQEYEIQLIAKVESVIKRMRWKSLEFCNKVNSSEVETMVFHQRNVHQPLMYYPHLNRIY